MQEKNVTLEIHDNAKMTVEKIELELIDGAYCTRIQSIEEAYKYILPGDTITIRYAVFNTIHECVDTFEVDYTFPESRLQTKGAIKEKNTKFDRIITYKEPSRVLGKTAEDDFYLQTLYDDAIHRVPSETSFIKEEYIILVSEIYFYSNYLSRMPNVGKKNIIRINSNNEEFQL